VPKSSDACYFCGKRVYILERVSAEGHFFHRGCFQCRQCGTTLRLGDFAFDEDDGVPPCDPASCVVLPVSPKFGRKGKISHLEENTDPPRQRGRDEEVLQSPGNAHALVLGVGPGALPTACPSKE
uniref:LIM zinc-binding domain-containing protein n=1 Tax=Chelonoidis abingdonii TaxID=106734 RepID=A0A8C0H919_CHEAB